jgi:hypothetical protein
MSPRKSPSKLRRGKDISRAELTARELEQMAWEAACRRAANARSRSGT